MQHISLNDYLSANSNWPKRLLGWEKYQVDRSQGHVSEEYDTDRYAPLLQLDSLDIEDYKLAEFKNLKMPQDAPLFISLGEEIFQTDVRTGRLLWYSIITSTVHRHATGRVCELGCGYGYNLHLLGRDSYGGEYSRNAVRLGTRLGKNISEFDYRKPDQYAFIQPNSTILSVHSVEQLPSGRAFIENLAAVRNNIREVINLEPCFLAERQTLLGMIRNRYNQLIDHNHDLIDILRSRPDIEILRFQPDVFGLHPLNSTHITVWRFRK